MANQRRYEVYVGALFALALGLLAWMSIKVGAIGGIGPQIHVTLPLPDAAGIQAGASVQIAGFEVGRVEKVSLDYDRAVASLGLDAAYDIPLGVVGRVRARSVLGEKYIELVPLPRVDGKIPSFDKLTDGAELAPAPSQVEIDEMVQQAGALLEGIDFERLNPAIQVLVADLYQNPTRLKSFFDNLDKLIANGAAASDQIGPLMSRATTTLDGVDAALASARSAADKATDTLQRADGLIANGDRRLDQVGPAVEDARSMMDKLDGLVDDVRGPINKAGPIVDDLAAAAADARVIAADLRRATPGVQRIVSNFEQIDKWEMRRLLREEGILIRLHPVDVRPPDGSAECSATAARTEEVVPKRKIDPSPACTEAAGEGAGGGGGAPEPVIEAPPAVDAVAAPAVDVAPVASSPDATPVPPPQEP